MPTNVSKPAIATYTQKMSSLNNDQAKEVGLNAIEKLASRVVSFEHEVLLQK